MPLSLADPAYWVASGERELAAALAAAARVRAAGRGARNVVLFLGDGMGLSTVTAARTLRGQRRGRPGEEERLSFETFPHIALAKVRSLFCENRTLDADT